MPRRRPFQIVREHIDKPRQAGQQAGQQAEPSAAKVARIERSQRQQRAEDIMRRQARQQR